MRINIIKDMGAALKDLAPYVKSGEPLRTGREFSNFALRPREVWANWLLCAVLQEIIGPQITFGEHPSDDGVIFDKETKQITPLEHVSALENEHNPLPTGNARIVNAIEQKFARGDEYAAGKSLVVFFDGAELFERSVIREHIYGKHNFIAVHLIGLLDISESGEYSYLVSDFRDRYGNRSLSYKVVISPNFDSWTVAQMTK